MGLRIVQPGDMVGKVRARLDLVIPVTPAAAVRMYRATVERLQGIRKQANEEPLTKESIEEIDDLNKHLDQLRTIIQSHWNHEKPSHV